jgi:hypothetical protein
MSLRARISFGFVKAWISVNLNKTIESDAGLFTESLVKLTDETHAHPVGKREKCPEAKGLGAQNS